MPERDAAPTTTLPDAVTAALGRLTSALDRLQAAAERRAGAQVARADRDDEFGLMQEDRARLAEELDAALARADKLRVAQTAVLARIGRAEAAITSVVRDLSLDDETARAMDADVD